MKIKLTIIAVLYMAICNAQTIEEMYNTESITGNIAHLGEVATANLVIDDANGDNEITKPLIVVEGFDPGTIINTENPYGETDYEDFIRTLEFSSSTNLRNLIWDENNKDYDIIYVDWENGVDFLERNAFALESVIEWVNTEKNRVGSTEPNVILGQSMGGVIARWALADMEERNLVHYTRLFISHDAPQQGANVPLSLQYLYRHAGNLQMDIPVIGVADVILPLFGERTIASYLTLLDEPATTQLLNNRATTTYTLDNNPHDTFYNNLRTKGLLVVGATQH